MLFRELENTGLIVRTKANYKQAYNYIARSKKDLSTSKSTIDIDKEWAYTISYHAMLRAGRALMISYGFRPKGKDQHKTVVLFTSNILGKQFKELVRKFDRMRRKNNDFIYEPNRPISEQEAQEALADAEELVMQIFILVKEKDPQKGLSK